MSNGNFKVKCIRSYRNYTTVGKIYDVINGVFTYDDGSKESKKYFSIDEMNRNFISQFELVNDNQSIHIYRHDNEVIATLKTGKQTTKTAKAKCNPADEFKFEIGAGLAFQRLMGGAYYPVSPDTDGVEKAETPVTAESFKVGDRVKALVEVGRLHTKDAEGEVIGFSNVKFSDKVMVEVRFDKDILGGTFNYTSDSHVWNVEPQNLEKIAVKESSRIDWTSFKSGKFAVHCDTEEKARAFLKECDGVGIKWRGGDKPSSSTEWGCYKEATLYAMRHGCGLGYCNINGLAQKDQPLPIINYTPSKPTVNEVSRKAEVGEWIRVTKDDGYSDNDYKVGDILKVVRNSDQSRSDGAYYKDEFCKFVSHGDYVVLEGYIPEDEPTIKEVKRPAKVGEWVKVIPVSKCIYKYGKYEPGDVILINKIYNDAVVEGNNNGTTCKLLQDEYVVLENYQPNNTPIDSNPESEQPISSGGMREVKRVAESGEYVKVVNAFNIPETDGKDEYANGDVLKIIRATGSHARYADGMADNGKDHVLLHSEYVVLENFDYSVFPKNEPFRKAKVGDKIKVVKDRIGHLPEIKNGDVLAVKRVDGSSIITTNGQVLWDDDTEYIIIEEASEVKPDTIEVGDTVKVIDDGKVWTSYTTWFEKYEPKLAGRYAYRRCLKNGQVLKVIAKHDSDCGIGMAYAIQESDYSEIYLVTEEAIKKVRN